MKPPTQKNCDAMLVTPLKPDVLLFGSLEGAEGMGELFEFRIEALSLKAKIDFDKVLGRNCSVHLKTHDEDNADRDFSGVLTEARWLGQRGDFYVYRLVLRPWLWLLSLTSDSRIFANMTPKQIIEQVFIDRKFSDVDTSQVQEQYPTLEYTVQYRETDLNFVLRLMEEYGIYYYFKFDPFVSDHDPSAHHLVLADTLSHLPHPKLKEVLYLPVENISWADKQRFNDWTKSSSMVTGVFTLNDYDYEGPGKRLLATEKYDYKFQHGDMEIYNHPGDYDKLDEGQTLAKVARDVEPTRNQHYGAAGYAPALTPGYTIKLNSPHSHSTESSSDQNGDPDSNQEPDPESGDYLVLRCAHYYGYQSYASSSSPAQGGAGYSGTYELAKEGIPYRMPQHTHRPVIVGTQSALVVGKQGEEIDVDEEGRICVQFYWDRKKKASRRIRVAQFWAGSHRGTLYLPRIGDEVLIEYDEGDPDRPLVVGSVYNGTNKVPTPLPAKKTHSGILTRSSKGGAGYHMLLFEDLAGSEFIKMRSQKDLMFKALNNEQRDIGVNQTENIGGDETINVGGPIPRVPPPTAGGHWTLNAYQKATINIGPPVMPIPMTQLVMDQQSITLNVGPDGNMSQIVMNQTGITLNVGPEGALAQIVMGPTGVTISGTPVSQLMVQPQGISTMTPMITFTAVAEVTFATPMVTIPLVTIGAGTCGGGPIL